MKLARVKITQVGDWSLSVQAPSRSLAWPSC
jgi:hypothetical protein